MPLEIQARLRPARPCYEIQASCENHIRRIVPTTTSGLPASFSPSPTLSETYLTRFDGVVSPPGQRFESEANPSAHCRHSRSVFTCYHA